MPRSSKVISLSEAISRYVDDNCQELAIGGMHMHNNPMALIRELIRQKKQIKKLVTSPSGSINAELLIGAGLVEEILTAYVGLEHLGLAPNYRKAVEKKTIKLWECDEPTIVYGLQAGAGGLPFIPYPRGLELSDMKKINPEYYRFTTDPYTGEQVMTCPAIKPKVAFIHCQVADTSGNAMFSGAQFTDRQMVFAADAVILQVEKVIAPEEKPEYPMEFDVPGFLVTAVVEAPYGCHPTSSHGYYDFDEAHLKAYLKACKGEAAYQQYLEDYIYSVDESGYFEKIGTDKLRQLSLKEGK